jgi:hypothetical protein
MCRGLRFAGCASSSGTKGYVEENRAHSGHSAFTLERRDTSFSATSARTGRPLNTIARRRLRLHAHPITRGASRKERTPRPRVRHHARDHEEPADQEPRDLDRRVGDRGPLPSDRLPGRPFDALPVRRRADRVSGLRPCLFRRHHCVRASEAALAGPISTSGTVRRSRLARAPARDRALMGHATVRAQLTWLAGSGSAARSFHFGSGDRDGSRR